ncbi:hypothetical protein M9H77_25914 [Catharanthus roseus]|uniref:Uncharacterized protein n=1 Tax=Catharanthus roseus TaxID=4058 RepID=A0ACC0AC90_CATRO|nr:hypothetical protein M9H77_25914 [Catharanthus roseus]
MTEELKLNGHQNCKRTPSSGNAASRRRKEEIKESRRLQKTENGERVQRRRARDYPENEAAVAIKRQKGAGHQRTAGVANPNRLGIPCPVKENKEKPITKGGLRTSIGNRTVLPRKSTLGQSSVAVLVRLRLLVSFPRSEGSRVASEPRLMESGYHSSLDPRGLGKGKTLNLHFLCFSVSVSVLTCCS